MVVKDPPRRNHRRLGLRWSRERSSLFDKLCLTSALLLLITLPATMPTKTMRWGRLMQALTVTHSRPWARLGVNTGINVLAVLRPDSCRRLPTKSHDPQTMGSARD